MKKSDKIFEVQKLTAKVKSAKSVALVDYRSLTVSQATELRNKVREAGGELQVTKNNLLRRALRENRYQVTQEDLKGPSLTLFANADELAPLKVLATFGKNINLLPLKIGFLDGKVLSAKELVRFAGLPGKQELRAKLVSMLASQPQKLVYALNWNIQRLVLALNAVKNKKQ